MSTTFPNIGRSKLVFVGNNIKGMCDVIFPNTILKQCGLMKQMMNTIF